MDKAAYAKLLMLYTGIEHAIDLTQSRLSRRAALARPHVARLHAVGIELLQSRSWPTGDHQLRDAWEKGVNSIPFLATKSMIFDEVSAQQDLLRLLYCLAGLSMVLVENDPNFIEEKKRRLVTIKPLKMLANEAELKAETPTDILSEINARLDRVVEFVQTK